jgi:hypothetical protein
VSSTVATWPKVAETGRTGDHADQLGHRLAVQAPDGAPAGLGEVHLGPGTLEREPRALERGGPEELADGAPVVADGLGPQHPQAVDGGRPVLGLLEGGIHRG